MQYLIEFEAHCFLYLSAIHNRIKSNSSIGCAGVSLSSATAQCISQPNKSALDKNSEKYPSTRALIMWTY